MNYNVYIGWDSREDIAYQVAKHSILSKSREVKVVPLIQSVLRDENLYWRSEDKLGTTEFTFTRFLVPYLNDYKGWAVFCDCDMVWQINPEELFMKADNDYAVMVVQHDYTPKQDIKMDGKRQLPYPRKNWSSMVLWNCDHPKNYQIDPEYVNTQSAQHLHRFQWLEDEEIGNLSCEYNWLVGWYKEPDDGAPKILHYTEGGPWFENYSNCEYADEWKEQLKDLYQL